MKKNTYAVLGLSRYGKAVANELVRNGMEVIAVDINEDVVNAAAETLPICKCADVSDPIVIEKLGLADVDVVIVAMADYLEASVMAITLCKDAGVQTVIAKCSTKMHQKVYKKVGADQVVFPEHESGVRLAKNLLSTGFADLIDLSEDVSLMEIDVPTEWVGKSLIELNVRKKYSINVIAIEYVRHTSIVIDPNEALIDGTKLVILAHTNKLNKLLKEIKK